MALASASTNEGVLGPKDNNNESSTSMTAEFLPARVWATPGSLSRPSTPPTDCRPLLITRITSGFNSAKLSAVKVLNGRSSVCAPTSIAPIAASNESAPDAHQLHGLPHAL